MGKFIVISMWTLGLALGFSINGSAAGQKAPHPANCAAMKKLGPACQQICTACAANFLVDGAREGDGFWRQCVRPIMTNSPQPARAIKANHLLPAAPGGGSWQPIAQQCHATNPHWGMR